MIGESGKEFKNPTNNPDTDKVVLLLDSKPKIETLRDIIAQTNPTIITFDSETHKLLLENKITHKISDEYVTDDDLLCIQQNSLQFAKWFEQKQVNSLLQYEQINLGGLFYIEFHYLLVPFLKKFVEISKIFQQYNSSKFIASTSIYNIVTTFTRNAENIKTDTFNKFLYDVIKLRIKIGRKFFTFNIKRSHYLKAKEISDKLIHYLFGPKNDVSKKYVLFVEFDTIKYKEIFSALPQSSVNLMFFGRRRPAIWNFKSFSIIKNSKCKVATLYDVTNRNFNLNRYELVEEKIEKLLTQDIFLKSFFSIFNMSFWDCLKPTVIELCRKRFLEAIFEIELTKKLFTKYRFKSIVVLSESGFNEQIVIETAKKFQVPIVLLQHGMGWETPETLKLKEFDGVSPTKSDKFIVWGEILDAFTKTHGVKPEKLEILGTPLYDEIFRKIKLKPLVSDKFVLLATSSPVKNMVQDLKIKTTYEYENVIQRICEIVSRLDKKLVIKLHPFQDESDILNIAKAVNPEIIVIKSGDILPLIESCELLITIDLSTTILEAQILEKPVISIHAKDYGYGNAVVFNSGSCLQVNVDKLEPTLNMIFNDDKFRNEMIRKGKLFVDSYVSHQGNSSKNILTFLDNFE